MEMYEVGGCVRDEVMGVKSNDIDFTVVLSGNEDAWHTMGGDDAFRVMVTELKSRGFTIFAETPAFFVAKGKFPKTEQYAHYAGKVADFVLARRESEYTDGRRPDSVEVGGLIDDIHRRDFTMNALAKGLDGSIIDMVGGRADIEAGLIRAVGDPKVRMQEDALRAVRAIRFAVTKDMQIESELRWAMEMESVLVAIRDNISDERIQAELSKMFRFDTIASLNMLGNFPALTRAMFAGRVSLDSTLKTKNRGKQ